MMDGLFLLLGSNVGGSKSFLSQARHALAHILGDPEAVSSIYSSEPWGNSNQEWFLNQVLVYDLPDIQPGVFLEELKSLEKQLGRKERIRWGPREIDIDILYWGQMIIQSDLLAVPHPAIPDRKFTLIPLVEIAPDKIHPVNRMSQKAMLENCKDSSKVILANTS